MNRDKLDNFKFLLGDWHMDYRIPKSKFSDAGTDTGSGSFKKILNKKYVQFEYSSKSGTAAKGIFAWDDKIKMYRYWWFENSGNYSQATCDFIDKNTLAMNWHDSLFVQTFSKASPDKIILKMQYPIDSTGHKSVLEVTFTRK